METKEEVSSIVTPRSVGIKYGLISAVISVVFFLSLALAGLNAFDNTWNWIGLVVSVVLVVLAHREYKANGTGFMSYGQGVGIAFWIALVSLAINFVITYLYVSLIDLNAMEVFYDAQAQKMAEQGAPDSQIDMALSWTRKLFWPMYIFMGLFFGVLVGAIVSIFTQKKSTEPAF